jgi:hypothetical protein
VTRGGRALAALVVSGVRPVTVLIDPVSGVIHGQQYELYGDLLPKTANGNMIAEEQFSDYRDVNGLQVAFTAVVTQSGQPFIRRHVRTFEYNVPLDPALFVRPS